MDRIYNNNIFALRRQAPHVFVKFVMDALRKGSVARETKIVTEEAAGKVYFFILREYGLSCDICIWNNKTLEISYKEMSIAEYQVIVGMMNNHKNEMLLR